MKFLGEKLAYDVKNIRSYCGKNLRDCSEDIGISLATLSRIENAGIPDVITLALVCKWLRMPMEKYFEPNNKSK